MSKRSYWIIAVRDIIESLGFTCEYSPGDVSYDLIVDNKTTVKVFVTSKPKKSPSLRNTTPLWRWNIGRRSDTADFLILIIAPHNAMFVIPKHSLDRIKSTLIQFCWPIEMGWQQYHESWGLFTNKGVTENETL